ncbi:MAG TPA: hypothetical protein VGO40_08290 [Longimicrobium sp.]|jgi:hypothetical protein|nr:hypothetical protein [Longimicrobium sp.]
MLTFYLQWLTALELAAVAAFSLAAGRAGAASPWHTAGWRLTGAAFTAFSVDLAAQLAFGSAAIAGGRGTPVMDAYLRAGPAFDHSRTFLMMAALVALLVIGVLRAPPARRFARGAAGLLAVGLVIGAAAGVAEGGFLRSLHYTAVAMGDIAELLLLLSTLFVLLLTNRVDRYLWALLAAYACSLALGIFWFSLFTQIGVARAWHPQPWSLNAVWVVLYAAMAVLAYRRWRAGRRGRPVYGMLGPQRPQLSMIG